jgi:hypothetical protein
MKLAVRFERAPKAELKRTLAARFRLVAGGGGAWRWQGAVARFTADGDTIDEALDAVDALQPIREVDRGEGFAPFAPAPPVSDGFDLVELVDATAPMPVPVPEEVQARFVFDDHVIGGPDGWVAFVRDANRCHFETLHLPDRAPIRLPMMSDRPRTAFSADGKRLLVGGPLDVLVVGLDDGAVTLLEHDDGGNGYDVCWVGAHPVAIGWNALTFHFPSAKRSLPCNGGRLASAVLGGRVIVAGTGAGTFLVGVRGEELRLVERDWRSLSAVWEVDGRILCSPAGEGVSELRGVEEAWARAFSAAGEPAELVLR